MRNRLWLIAILLGYSLLAMAYSIAVPLAETPDESEHFRYMQHIALTGHLPVMQPEREENATLEAHQPPLLYLTGAVLSGWLDLNPADNLAPNGCFSFAVEDNGRQHAFLHRADEWPPQRGVYQAFYLMRWFSIVLGLGTVCLTWLIGRQLLPGDNRFGLLAAALLAFNPQWIQITASMNNDVPATCLGAAIIYLSIRAAQRPGRRWFVVLGLLLGLGFLTKFALLAFWPLPFLAALVPFLRPRFPDARSAVHAGLSQLVPNLLLVALLPTLVAGWWYWRGFRLYGDPLMWQVTLAAKGSVIARTAPFALADLADFFVTHFQSYWLWFGWLNVKAPRWVYWLIFGLVVAAIIGLGRLWRKRHLPVNRWAFTFCGLGILAIYASLLQYVQSINWTGYQGRLAFAAAAPIAVLLALGLVSLNRTWLGPAVGGGLFALSLLAIPLVILPAFPRPQIYQPTPDMTRTCIRFASGLQVEAVDAPPRIEPGRRLLVTLYGFGLEPSPGTQAIKARLVGWEGEVVGQGGRSLTWDAGQVVSTSLALPIEEAWPTRALLQVGMTDSSGAWQTATSATGRVLEVPYSVEQVKIAPAAPYQPEPAYGAHVNYGDQLALIGYDVEAATSTITLYWQALAPMMADYTTFVHLLAEDGTLVAQHDGQPQRGRYPTGIWDVGEIVADAKQIDLAAYDGAYQLAVGVYLLESLERLPAFSAAGTRLPHNQFILPVLSSLETK